MDMAHTTIDNLPDETCAEHNIKVHTKQMG